jgi:ATP-dependent DNA helicase RecQ
VFRLQKERGQKFGAGQSIDILLGKKTDKIAQFRHAELSVFGIGSDLSEAEWRGVVRQLLAAGYLAVEPNYGALVLTESSSEVLRGDAKVMMRREVKPARSSRAARSATPAAAPADFPESAAPLFEHLRAWRAAMAKEQGVPAYVIFHDATLRAIATLRPATLAQLGTISGVGQSKLTKFGQPVLDAIAEIADAPGMAPGPSAAVVGSRFEGDSNGSQWEPDRFAATRAPAASPAAPRGRRPGAGSRFGTADERPPAVPAQPTARGAESLWADGALEEPPADEPDYDEFGDDVR